MNPSGRYASALFIVLVLGFAVSVAPNVRAGCSPQEDPAGGQDESAWRTDAQAAVATARSENKDLLLLFTGSDWCPPCIRLEQQVLGQPAFIEGASKNFVLLKFDFPENKPQDEDLAKQNEEWADRFGVSAFPTIVLLDREELPYGFTGFRDEGPEAFLTHLDELLEVRRKRDEALQKAETATGLERARLLDEALSALDQDVARIWYNDIIEEIGELDANDEAGLRTRYFAERDREMRQAIMSNIAMVSRLRPPAEAIDFIEKTLAENRLPAEYWLRAQQIRLRLLRSEERTEEAEALMNEMIDAPDLDPETRQRLVNNQAFWLASLGRTDDAFAFLEKKISALPQNLLMTIAVGDLHDSLGNYEKAIAAYDKAIVAAASDPRILLEVVQARADVLFEMGQHDEALAALDKLIEDTAVPARERAAALLHKSLLLRETGRRRAAILAENQALEIASTPAEKAEVQNLINQFRSRFDGASGASVDDSGDGAGDDDGTGNIR